MRERWVLRAKRADFDGIAGRFGLSPITARLLANRGITEDEDIRDYLERAGKPLADPALMKDLPRCAEILSDKIARGKKIRIIGDYDVDSVMSTYILYDALTNLGGVVSFAIPDRVQDGYGINIHLIDRAYEDGIDTIITCDNGIYAHEQAAHAKELGMTILITDHHDIPLDKPLPPADTVTDPKREDCSYPFKGLCGAGVALQVVRHLYSLEHMDDPFRTYLPFAALATVCDVMELVGENRTIVKLGLPAIRDTMNLGLRALIEAQALSDRDISVYHCGFVLGPAINASGRLETASEALELLITDEADQAVRAAQSLHVLNEERKNMTDEGLKAAKEIASSEEYQKDKVLVIYLPQCHESIAGIVAGRIKEHFYKPTLVLTKGSAGIKGSGRSIEAYNMFAELSKCVDLFSKFGGHPMAAGFSMAGETEEEQLASLKALRERLNAQSVLTEEDLTPVVRADMQLPFSVVNLELIKEWDRLGPYGTGNPRPLFAQRNVYVHSVRFLGRQQNVIKMSVTEGSPFGPEYTAVLFEQSEVFEENIKAAFGETAVQEMIRGSGRVKLDIMYAPEIDEYGGRESIQMVIKSYRPATR